VHHIYTTPSLILRRDPLDTSASYLILTRDFGLIRARAQGVRKDASRLKGTLQEYSLATIAYVQTKAGWKITTAIPERNFWNEITGGEARKILARIADVLIRLITGESKDEKIFTLTIDQCVRLEQGIDPNEVEIAFLSRLLHLLGYMEKDFAKLSKKELIQAINKGLRESQLWSYRGKALVTES